MQKLQLNNFKYVLQQFTLTGATVVRATQVLVFILSPSLFFPVPSRA